MVQVHTISARSAAPGNVDATVWGLWTRSCALLPTGGPFSRRVGVLVLSMTWWLGSTSSMVLLTVILGRAGLIRLSGY